MLIFPKKIPKKAYFIDVIGIVSIIGNVIDKNGDDEQNKSTTCDRN